MVSSASTPRVPASFLATLAPAVILSWGWPRRLVALICGAVGALAMPPLGFIPALVVALVVAVWLIDGAANYHERAGALVASVWTAFGDGWWWGFGYFLASLWWLGSAFLVDAREFAWALPFGVVALPAGLALFPALGFAVARAVWPQGPARILALAFALGLSEWLRAVALTGFPWNELGLALGQNLALAQGAAFVGEHGLTLAAIVIFAAPATLWEGRGWRRLWPTATALAALSALAAFGAHRLAEPQPAPVAGVKLRILQTNVSQGPEFSSANGAAILTHYLDLSQRAGSQGHDGLADATRLVWPELAFPFLLSREPVALQRIADFLRDGAVLATGAARADAPAGGRPARYYNSILTLNRTGLLPARYDKRHLVPFGEYTPFESVLRRLGVTEMVHFAGGYQPGQGSNLLPMPGAPDALALICYEAIFPSEWGGARDGAAERAGWILNVTDDAWFGVTPGPHQHFAQARLRAIEWGLPLVRAANGGLSAIVDSYGRIISAVDFGAEGVVEGELPGALPPTYESRWGSAAFGLALAALLAAAIASRARA